MCSCGFEFGDKKGAFVLTIGTPDQFGRLAEDEVVSTVYTVKVAGSMRTDLANDAVLEEQILHVFLQVVDDLGREFGHFIGLLLPLVKEIIESEGDIHRTLDNIVNDGEILLFTKNLGSNTVIGVLRPQLGIITVKSIDQLPAFFDSFRIL